MCDSPIWHTSILMSSDSSMSTDVSYAPHFNGKVIEIRAMGYNLYTAIYELIDNSVSKTCGSKRVRIILYFKDQRLHRISIIDNGVGMTIKQLREAIIFNLIKVRQEGDIGKFHVGMKYAFISLGSDITMISKKENGTMVGVHMNIEQMEELDTFAPTDIVEAVTDEWEKKHITPSQFEQFKKQSSGTYIEIRNLLPSCRPTSQRGVPDMEKGLSTCYTNLPNNCIISVESSDKPVPTYIVPKDMFYVNEPQRHLDESYRTIFLLYKDGEDVRLIEMISESRHYTPKKMTGGTSATPVYWEHTEVDTGKKSKKIVMKKLDTLPPIGDQIGQIDVIIIQVNRDSFEQEKQWFPESSTLAIDRKAFYFLRGGVRCVGSAKQLGSKFSDRVFTTTERQRCQVSFDPCMDDKFGSKFNKQMEDHALPCSVLNTALVTLYKGITAKWNKEWKEVDAPAPAPNTDSDSESDEKSDSDVEQHPVVAPFELDVSNEVVIPVAASSTAKPSDELDEIPAVKPVDEMPDAKEPDAEEPDVEEAASEEPDVEEPDVAEHVIEVPAAEDPIEVAEEEMPQFDDDVPEFEQPLIPRKNVVTFDLTHFTNEQYEHFKEMAETFGLII